MKENTTAKTTATETAEKQTNKVVRTAITATVFSAIREAVEKSKILEFDTTSSETSQYFYIGVKYKNKAKFLCKVYCHSNFVDICIREKKALELQSIQNDIYKEARYSVNEAKLASVLTQADNRNDIEQKAIRTLKAILQTAEKEAEKDEQSEAQTATESKTKQTKKQTKKTK